MTSKSRKVILIVLFVLYLPTLGVFHVGAASESVSVLTNRYDINRSGANLNETILNTSNVNVQQFGKLFTRQVVGDIYAQPLYYPTLSIPNKGTHNVVFVATSDNNVYAFDADDPQQSTALWQINLGPYVTKNLYKGDIWDGQDGVLSTPVIDPATQTMYVISHHPNGNSNAKHVLHALDITTGAERTALGSPVTIQATVPSFGCGNVGGVLSFDSNLQLQRPGLLLLNGVVYAGFGSSGSSGYYHGWLLGFDTKNIRQQTVRFNASAGKACRFLSTEAGRTICKTTPDYVSPSAQEGFGASFWQSGTGLSSDGTSIFGVTGNGAFSAYEGGTDYGDSVLKLNPKLVVQDYFTPNTQFCLDKTDYDLGITGALIIPNTNLVIVSGKDANLYLIDKRNMGKYDAETHTNPNFQTLPIGQGVPYNTPIFWNSPTGPVLYTWNSEDNAKQWGFAAFNDGLAKLNPTPLSVSTFHSPGSPGGILALSANGSTPGTGILWGTQQTDDTHAGILRAWDATDISKELWDSDMAANGRDKYGKIAKFNQPTIANGKVYQGTFSDTLDVYGLLPS